MTRWPFVYAHTWRDFYLDFENAQPGTVSIPYLNFSTTRAPGSGSGFLDISWFEFDFEPVGQWSRPLSRILLPLFIFFYLRKRIMALFGVSGGSGFDGTGKIDWRKGANW